MFSQTSYRHAPFLYTLHPHPILKVGSGHKSKGGKKVRFELHMEYDSLKLRKDFLFDVSEELQVARRGGPLDLES
jgi:hypothetical protein